MKPQTELLAVIENLVIMTLIDEKLEKQEFVLIQKLLNTPEWFFEFTFDEKELKSIIKNFIITLQGSDREELHTLFKANSDYLDNTLDVDLKRSYSNLLLEFTNTLEVSKEESELLEIHQRVVENPMSTLGATRFAEYIESLMIYAFVDEKNNEIPQQEAMLILNEIKVYVDGNYKVAKKEFFRLYDKALKNSKNHMSVRFSGVMVENFLELDDAQDAYLINTLKRLSNLNEKKSTQERIFDGITKAALKRAFLLEEKRS